MTAQPPSQDGGPGVVANELVETLGSRVGPDLAEHDDELIGSLIYLLFWPRGRESLQPSDGAMVSASQRSSQPINYLLGG